ncbi:hypothetical protein WL13_10955 [Burkholderia ubonensis]|nr:hypothetical protein WL13_10955 [Burkholderia ubonensis]KWB15955.1 hypothetical protein WL33_07765 [Burkholderia ubonensis]
MLANGAEAAEKRLRALRVAKSLHLALTPARGQVPVFSAVVDPGRRLYEDVLHVGQLGHFGLRCPIAAQLISHDLLGHGVGAKHSPEEASGCGFVAELLQQHVQLGAVFIQSLSDF